MLQDVPTYVSDNSYVLGHIPDIKNFINSLSESFKSPENSSIVDVEHNVEVQMLSKMFSEEKMKVYLIRYAYYKAFSERMKDIYSGKNYYDYLDEFPYQHDEGFLSHDVRILGEAIYKAFNRELYEESLQI